MAQSYYYPILQIKKESQKDGKTCLSHSDRSRILTCVPSLKLMPSTEYSEVNVTSLDT